MKANAGQIRAALDHPRHRLILLHGPDAGLAAELSARLGKAMGEAAERVDLDGSALKADPALAPSAINEVLRIEAPAQLFSRVAAERVELAGVPVEEGQRVAVLYASANRDATGVPDEGPLPSIPS